MEKLELAPGARILDLACGQGRHAIPLAQHGYRVTGLDLSEPSLTFAREAAAEAGAKIDFVQADMREIPFADEFDAVVNIFTAFGYLESEQEDQLVLARVARRFAQRGSSSSRRSASPDSCGGSSRRGGASSPTAR